MIIYKIVNKHNSKIYIGQTTKSAQERFETHCADAKYKSKNTVFHKAIRKYGPESFEIEILEETEEPNEREKFWIAELKSLVPNGYNLTEGGQGGDTSKSPNFIAKMEEWVQIGRWAGANNSMYGSKRVLSENHRKILREAASKSNRCRVVCDGKEFPSIKDAQRAFPGVSVRKRVDSPFHLNWYRIDRKISRK